MKLAGFRGFSPEYLDYHATVMCITARRFSGRSLSPWPCSSAAEVS